MASTAAAGMAPESKRAAETAEDALEGASSSPPNGEF
jgi:hypothetical protein